MKRDRAEIDDYELELAIQFSLVEKNVPVNNEYDFLDISQAISESLADEQARVKELYESDRAIAESIVEADKKSISDEELDYAFALSLESNEWAQNNFWLCSFCSYYSPPSCRKCIMCDTASDLSQKNADEPQRKLLSLQSRMCGLPGCRLFPTGGNGDFCSAGHRRAAEQKRILPAVDMGVYTVFLGPSGDYSMHMLTKAHPEHPLVKAQFLDAWLNPSYGSPHVMRIYKIVNNPQILHSFEALNVLGNVRSRFHGTSQHQECSFGSNPAIPPCDRSDCRVCNICRTSFSLEYSAQNGALRMSLRYGRGLYFSATSSKSHDYNGASQKLLRTGDNKRQMFAWRSMFLCSVTIGKPYSTKKGQLPDGMCPPPGYDSVEGEPGEDLNYDEVVVYNNDQAVPSYLIIYSLPVREG